MARKQLAALALIGGISSGVAASTCNRLAAGVAGIEMSKEMAMSSASGVSMAWQYQPSAHRSGLGVAWRKPIGNDWFPRRRLL